MTASDLTGTEILGYRIAALIAEGGMGSVWRAENRAIGKVVAIKVLHSSLAQDPEWVEGFVREARIQVGLEHPNIVQVENFSREHLAMVMEYVDGETLAEVIGFKVGPIPHARALPWMLQILSAMECAHGQAEPVIHRDIKPANIIVVSADGTVKVTDFGIASIARAAHLDHTADPPGTPAYMAPEQFTGAGSVDQRADIYALGVTFYEMLAGRPPFISDGEGKSYEGFKRAHLRLLPPDPRSFYPHIPNTLVKVVLRCLEKVPANRNSSVAELRNTLEQVAHAPRINLVARAQVTRALSAPAGFPLAALRREIRGGLVQLPPVIIARAPGDVNRYATPMGKLQLEEEAFREFAVKRCVASTSVEFNFRTGDAFNRDREKFPPNVLCEHKASGQRAYVAFGSWMEGYPDGLALRDMVWRFWGAGHANVVRYLDLFGIGKRSAYALVQEATAGPCLAEFVAPKNLPLPLSVVKNLLLPVLDGLAFAHGRGVHHGSLGPSDIILDETDQTWLTPRIHDFGLTALNIRFGVTFYFGADGEDYPLRDDLWSVGAMLHEFTTGMPLPRGWWISGEQRLLDPGIQAELAEVIRKALTSGFDDADSFADALEQCPETTLDHEVHVPELLQRLRHHPRPRTRHQGVAVPRVTTLAHGEQPTAGAGDEIFVAVEVEDSALVQIREIAYRPDGLREDRRLLLGCSEQNDGCVTFRVQGLAKAAAAARPANLDTIGVLLVNPDQSDRPIAPLDRHGEPWVCMVLERDTRAGSYDLWYAAAAPGRCPSGLERLGGDGGLFDAFTCLDHTAQIWKHAWAALHSFTLSEPDVEIGGYLLGHVDESEQMVSVYDACLVRSPRPRGLRGPDQDIETAVRELRKTSVSQEVVGWWHTHPTQGIVMSDPDQYLHWELFHITNDRWWRYSVSLVLAPDKERQDVRCGVYMPHLRGNMRYIGDQLARPRRGPDSDRPVLVNPLLKGVVRGTLKIHTVNSE